MAGHLAIVKSGLGGIEVIYLELRSYERLVTTNSLFESADQQIDVSERSDGHVLLDFGHLPGMLLRDIGPNLVSKYAAFAKI